VNNKAKSDCVHCWHWRLGHRDGNAVLRLANEGLASGMKVISCSCSAECEVCIKGKMARQNKQKQAQRYVRNRWSSIVDIFWLQSRTNNFSINQKSGKNLYLRIGQGTRCRKRNVPI
jgi:hypothetical protein